MSFDAELMAILLDAAGGLPQVEKKRMFDFEALWAGGNIFALVREGRISLRAPDPDFARELSSLAGASPFEVPGKGGSARWINLPERMHDEPHELRAWVQRAHAIALAAPKKPPRRPRRREK